MPTEEGERLLARIHELEASNTKLTADNADLRLRLQQATERERAYLERLSANERAHGVEED